MAAAENRTLIFFGGVIAHGMMIMGFIGQAIGTWKCQAVAVNETGEIKVTST
ncbi:hypothetical protein EMIT07CA2_20462 [Brevibacillus sp. IT-7CA2]